MLGGVLLSHPGIKSSYICGHGYLNLTYSNLISIVLRSKFRVDMLPFIFAAGCTADICMYWICLSVRNEYEIYN